jgi:Tol biopolymer transport system component
MVNGEPQEAAFVVDRRNINVEVLMRPGTLLMKTPVDVWLYTAPLDPSTGKITAAAVPLGDASIDGARPRYSPDGQAIAYVIAGDDAPVLKVYQLAVNRDLTFQPTRGILGGVSCWSAAGNSVVFISRRFPANDLVLSSLNVRNKEETIPATQSSFALQTCVGDLGAGIADNRVRVRNLRDASERVVYSPPGGVVVSDPVFSRDGARLAFFERRNPASVSLRVIPTSGGMPRELARFTDPSSVDAFHRRIAWSHDNRFVYFSRLIDNDEYETFRVPVDGGAATSTNYKGPGAVGIDLAPDGNHIVSRWGRENSAEIWALENFLPTAR